MCTERKQRENAKHGKRSNEMVPKHQRQRGQIALILSADVKVAVHSDRPGGANRKKWKMSARKMQKRNGQNPKERDFEGKK